MGTSRPDPEIVVWHIGGSDSYGPIDVLLRSPFRDHVRLVVFEARDNSNDAVVLSRLTVAGVQTTLINTCVSDAVGQAIFRVNQHPLSSSLFAPTAKWSGEHMPSGDWLTWGEDTQLLREVTVRTQSIDSLVTGARLPPPDVVSIDAQGAELMILKGGMSSISSATSCVLSEVEFCDIYEGQGLFDGQFALLRNAGFRLVDIFNQQFWHPGPPFGRGFLTVGEALFLREPGTWAGYPTLGASDRVQKLLKLGAISFCFELYSHVCNIVAQIQAECAASGLGPPASQIYPRLLDVSTCAAEHALSLSHDRGILLKRYSASPGGPVVVARQSWKRWVSLVTPPLLHSILSRLVRRLCRLTRRQRASSAL